MANYIFLVGNFSEGPTRYFAIPETMIETLNVSDTYDDYGQRISSGDAGDYITLNSEKAVKVANDAWNEEFKNEDDYDEYTAKWNREDYISAYDFYEYFDAIIANKELKDDEDYKLICESCQGFTYWNGSNYKTITTSVENGEASHSTCDEEITKELNEAIKNMEWVGEGFGSKTYEYKNWVIIDSNVQGTWESYEILSEMEHEIFKQC